MANPGLDNSPIKRVVTVDADGNPAYAGSGSSFNDVDVNSVVPGTGATNLGKAEDGAHTSGDVGVMALAVRTDTPADKAANNDYEPLQISGGYLWNRDYVPGAIGDNRKVVAAAATAEALASSTACRSVVITAETDNTGVVVVGGSTVVAALGTRRGTPLNAGESLSLDIDNLSKIFLDVTVSGDGVTYTYTT